MNKSYPAKRERFSDKNDDLKDKSERARNRVRDYLQSQRREGFWPYVPGRDPSTEATAWSLIYFLNDPKVVETTCKFLVEHQNTNGGWSTITGDGPSDWTTSLAIFALRSAASRYKDEKLQKAIANGIEYLSSTKTEFYIGFAKTIIGLIRPEELEVGLGWPWSVGCFHWVEPTSYNLFACKIPNLASQQSNILSIVQKANLFLVNNTCQAGGWNHGSHLALGVNLPPYVVTTAEALLALQDIKDHPAIEKAFDFLQRNSEAKIAGQDNSAMALAWLSLAYHAYDRPYTHFVEKLIDSQRADGSFGPNIMVTALSAIALDTVSNINPLRITWKAPAPPP